MSQTISYFYTISAQKDERGQTPSCSMCMNKMGLPFSSPYICRNCILETQNLTTSELIGKARSVIGGNKEWTSRDQTEMIDLVTSGTKTYDVAKILGYLSYEIMLRVAPIAAEDFLRTCSHNNGAFAECAPDVAVKIMNKWDTREAELIAALVRMSPYQILLYLNLILESIPMFTIEMSSIDLLIRIGILKEYQYVISYEVSSESSDEVSSESSDDVSSESSDDEKFSCEDSDYYDYLDLYSKTFSE